MKTLKALGFVPVMLAILLVTGAAARDYGKSGMVQPVQPLPNVQQQQQGQFNQFNQPQFGTAQPQYGSGQLGNGEGVYYMGTLSSIDPSANQVVVNTEVPGLLGPQKADVPFVTSPDTTMTICFRSIGACDTYFAGDRGWDVLRNLQDISSLSTSSKRVLVIGNPDTNEVVHMQIDYGV